MSDDTCTTRWRDQPVAPPDYDDVATGVRVARAARGRVVEFDWMFTSGELAELRRAVYEWGSPSGGRYRTFDARVLHAINQAIDDGNSRYVLSERAAIDAIVACDAEGDRFTLRGRAPFDVVFGYGRAAVGDSPGTPHLGPTVRRKLADAVGLLNWDLQRLQEPGLRPVVNTLFGVAADYGIGAEAEPTGPVVDVAVHFRGPFAIRDDVGVPCLFTDPLTGRTGVYLWTIDVAGQARLWYIGQTRRPFGTRLAEHVASYLSGAYELPDPSALARGEHRRSAGDVAGSWPGKLPAVLRQYDSRVADVLSLTRILRIHVAPLEGDRRLFDRVEGTLGRHFRTHPDHAVRDVFEPGIRLPGRIPYDRPMRLLLSSEAPIAGWPKELRA